MLVIAATAVARTRDAACLACLLEESASLGGGMVYRFGLVGKLTGWECLNRSIIGAVLLGASEFWFWLWLVILLVCGLFEIR